MKKSELIKLLNDIDGDPEILDGEEREINTVIEWVGNTVMIESDYKSQLIKAWDNGFNVG